MMKVLTFKNRSVPVYMPTDQLQYMEKLRDKLSEYTLQLDFYKRWKRIKSIEVVRDVAIFNYNDGTKLYLEVC